MHLFLWLSSISFREGNVNPFQYSCMENPTDRGAWWAAVHGVAKSRTWLKRLSSSSSNRGRMRKHNFHCSLKVEGITDDQRERVSGQPKHRSVPLRDWVLNSEFPGLNLHVGPLGDYFFLKWELPCMILQDMFDVCRYVDRRIAIKPVD